jgi:hypothetical protein
MSASSFTGKPAKSQVAQISDFFFAAVPGGVAALPASIEVPVKSLQERERQQTLALETKLQQSWQDVENWLRLNEQRTSDLQTLDLKPLQHVTYWNKDTLSAHLGLNSFLDEAGDDAASQSSGKASGGTGLPSVSRSADGSTKQAPKRRSRVVFKSAAQVAASSSASPSDPSTPTTAVAESVMPPRPPGSASAVMMEAADPNAPLRRVFGPMLQKREQLPKELTILFSSLDGIQKGEFREMEEALKTCALSASLHTPFVKIQHFIMRHLAKSSLGAQLEKAYCETADPKSKELAATYDTLRTLWSEDDSESQRKTDATQTMWDALAAELSARRTINADAIQCTSACVEFESKMEQELPAMLEKCAQDVNEEFQLIENDAKEAFATTNELYRIAEEAAAASSATYSKERAALLDGIKSSEYQAKHSQVQQEKMIRRIREAVKELRVEQGRHEVFISDLVVQRVRLQQLDVAYDQFREALQQRQSMMTEAHSTCQTLNAVLAKAAETRDKILHQCRLHVNRTITEERLRCRRMVDRSAQNCQAWARVTNDIAALFEARREHVHKKSDESWQLNYLFAQERSRTMANIEAIFVEYKKIEAVWGTITKEQERHELASTALEQLEKNQVCQATRRVMMDLDDERGIAKASLAVQELLFAEKDLPCRSLDSTTRLLALCASRRKNGGAHTLPGLKSSITQSVAATMGLATTAPRPPPRHLSKQLS